jgi:hypothetical protein
LKASWTFFAGVFAVLAWSFWPEERLRNLP